MSLFQGGWPILSDDDRIKLMLMADFLASALHRLKGSSPEDSYLEEDDWDDRFDDIKRLLAELLHCFPECRLGPEQFKFRGIKVRIDREHRTCPLRYIIQRWLEVTDDPEIMSGDIYSRLAELIE